LEAKIDKLPTFSQGIGTANSGMPDKTCMELSIQIEDALITPQPESWWQKFVQTNIAKILQGYVRCFPLVNIGIGKTKYPDFLLETHDGYLDVLEIKKPDTTLLSKDNSHDNYFIPNDMSKAISQIKHYLVDTQQHTHEIRDYFQRKYNADVRIVSPRGIILAGDTRNFSQQEKDDFRLLTQGYTEIRFITYDELLIFCKKLDEKSLT
jgi:hypothetical protein